MEDNNTDDIRSDKRKSKDTKSDEKKSEGTRPDDMKSEDTNSGDPKYEDKESDYTKSDDRKSGNTKSKNEKSEETILKITDLRKSFGDNTVLKDVNLIIKKGETVVILGRSGTGKSVILKCIIGLIIPDSGDIQVFGEKFLDIPENKENELRIRMGFLFQSGALYDSMTVRQNLEFPIIRQPGYKREDLTPKVTEMLENVGLAEAIDKVPSELSGGMQKRIGLARTLMLDPEIILYDEPTTGLDPVTSNEISHLILEMQKKYNVTSLIVTHDMACAKLVSNRIVVLNEGTFAAVGTYEELEKSDDAFVKGFFEFS